MLDYEVFDADTHYYEPVDAFTRHLAPAFASRGVRVEEHEGSERVYVGDRLLTTITDYPWREVPRPGALRELLAARKQGQDVSHGNDALEPMRAEYMEREPRLKVLDEQGVEACLLVPSLALTVEHFMRDDVELTYANLRSFNTWLSEHWGFAHEDRLFALPLISLLDRDHAVDELEHVVDKGARVVHIRPGPQGGRSPADPHFDPFWERVSQTGTIVALHASESGYNELFSPAWGENPVPAHDEQSALQWTCFFGDRPIMDTLAALVFHNLFGRFPDLRVISIENGSLWVPYLLAALDKMKGMARNGPWPGGRITGRPSEIFREHVYVAPFHEEDITGLVGVLGAERVLCGSDYPHPEGVAQPQTFADYLGGLSDRDVKMIMRDNLRSLLFPGLIDRATA